LESLETRKFLEIETLVPRLHLLLATLPPDMVFKASLRLALSQMFAKHSFILEKRVYEGPTPTRVAVALGAANKKATGSAAASTRSDSVGGYQVLDDNVISGAKYFE
jgi:hypothetical protein